jgi:hypothetical protein
MRPKYIKLKYLLKVLKFNLMEHHEMHLNDKENYN